MPVFSSRIRRTDAHGIKQGFIVVQPRRGYLCDPTHAQGSRQCPRHARDRCSSPRGHAYWASATRARQVRWYVEIPLPTGDVQNIFFIFELRWVLSFFQCIIWLAVALIAEIPPVVCPFPVRCYSAYRFAGLPESRFEWCFLSLLFLVRCSCEETDRSFCDPTDVWNEVCFMFTILYPGLILSSRQMLLGPASAR